MRLTKKDLDGMSEIELKQAMADVKFEIDRIKIQFKEKQVSMESEQYKEWEKKARIALSYKVSNYSQCQLMLGVANSKAKAGIAGSPASLSKGERLDRKKQLTGILERDIIEEIKLLITPEQFIECVERAKVRASYEERLNEIKSMRS